MKTKSKYSDIKAKDMEMILFHQHVAAIRCVKVEKRYLAVAEDIGALMQNKKATNSAELYPK